MTRKIGLGYTIFEYHNGKSMPIANFRARPGNIEDAMRVLDKRLKSISRNKFVLTIIGMTFIYAFSIRVFLIL